jgi:hypothetical protein
MVRCTIMTTLASQLDPQPAWDADTIDQLCAMLAVGTPLRQIAVSLGCTQAVAASKARQLGRAPKYFR